MNIKHKIKKKKDLAKAQNAARGQHRFNKQTRFINNKHRLQVEGRVPGLFFLSLRLSSSPFMSPRLQDENNIIKS